MGQEVLWRCVSPNSPSCQEEGLTFPLAGQQRSNSAAPAPDHFNLNQGMGRKGILSTT